MARRRCFTNGTVCALQPTPHSPPTASCSVEFAPVNFPTVFPKITATYSGDSQHARSVGHTVFGVVTGTGPPSLSGNSVDFSAVCSAGVASCTDTVDLFANSGSLPATASVAKSATLLGRKSFTEAGGSTVKIKIPLNKAGKSLKRGKVRVRLVLTSKGAGASNSGTRVIKATLKKK